MSIEQSLGDQITLGANQQFEFDFQYDKLKGKFVIHRPSLKEQLAIGVMEANLLGGVNREAHSFQTRNLAIFMSTFSSVIDESPAWFDLDSMGDYGILEALYLKYVELVKPFRRAKVSDDKEAGKG